MTGRTAWCHCSGQLQGVGVTDGGRSVVERDSRSEPCDGDGASGSLFVGVGATAGVRHIKFTGDGGSTLAHRCHITTVINYCHGGVAARPGQGIIGSISGIDDSLEL